MWLGLNRLEYYVNTPIEQLQASIAHMIHFLGRVKAALPEFAKRARGQGQLVRPCKVLTSARSRYPKKNELQ